MSIICWNVRGLNNETRRLDLHILKAYHKPTIVALLENKLNNFNLELLKSQFGNQWQFITSQYKGRIIVGWETNYWNANIVDNGEQQISIKFHNKGGLQIATTFVYAKNLASERLSLWKQITELAKDINIPWIVTGDFNSVLKTNEKKGGLTLRVSQVAEFNNCVLSAGLVEAIHSGLKYTWRSGKSKKITSRLDRVLGNAELFTKITNLKVTVLPCSTSDHCPLLVQFNDDDKMHKGKPFRYANHWPLIDGFDEVVNFNTVIIPPGNHMYRFVMLIKTMKNRLKEWNKNRPKNNDNITKFHQHLEEIQHRLDEDPLNEDLNNEFHTVQKCLKEEIHKKAVELKQKAKEKWLMQGDECNNFFYAKMSIRQHHNNLLNCIDEHGDTSRYIQNIEEQAISYFTNLYNGDSNDHLPQVNCRRIISTEGSSMLIAPIHERELREAIYSIHNDSSPGPDGMGAAFFKQHWINLKDLMLKAYNEALQTGEFIKEINHTFISLIPKVKKPDRIEEYRPIACCNVTYKILSKIICTRLNKVLPDLISQCQSAFIKGRCISENSLLAHELIRNFNKKGAEKICIKVDLQKAYDKVNRSFIIHMLDSMGVPVKLLKLIKYCIDTPTFSILVNGKPTGYIQSNRGIRQGDPLSPYLFAVAMEWFTLQMELAHNQGLIQPVFNHQPYVTHLLYADDLLVVIKGNLKAAEKIKDIFRDLESFAGLKLNEMKTKCYFNKFCSNKQSMLDKLGFTEGSLPVKYLGVPLSNNNITDVECGKLINEIRDKLQGWRSKLLSFAGRVELVHTVITSKVRFWLQTFQIPDCSIAKINSVCANFIWRGGIHKIKYSDLCRKKKEGGVGLKNLFELKKVYCLKQAWKVLTSNKLWATWMRARYLKDNFWTTKIDNNASVTWKNILKIRNDLQKHLDKQIANGRNTDIWKDPWLNSKSFIDRLGWDIFSTYGTPNWRVAEIVDNGTWKCNNHSITLNYIEEIRKKYIYTDNSEDKWVWKASMKDQFKFKDIWEEIREKNTEVIWSDVVWSKSIPPKMAHTLYKAIMRKLPTKDRLKKWKILDDSKCNFCCIEEETHDHIFFDCEFSKRIWNTQKCRLQLNKCATNLKEELEYLHSRSHLSDLMKEIGKIGLAVSLWFIWKERNGRTFENKKQDTLTITKLINREIATVIGRIPTKKLTIASEQEKQLLEKLKKMELIERTPPGNWQPP